MALPAKRYLNGPWLAGIDKAGSLLICGFIYAPNQILTPTGDFLPVYNIPCEQREIFPVNSRLFFTCEDGDVFKYTLEEVDSCKTSDKLKK